MTWEREELDINHVKELSKLYNLNPLEASLLYRRKLIESEEIAFFLENNLSFTHNPFLFKDMPLVLERLEMAQEEKEVVLVFGDKDVDGITSTVIASSLLKNLNISHECKIPVGNDLYGLSEEAVLEAYKKGITLIITVDCGISAHGAILKAKELGIDVIVVDHHLDQQETLPEAYAIINPNLKNCTYPFSYLAGCGVISKVFWASLYAKTPFYNVNFCFLYTDKKDTERLYLIHTLNGITLKTVILILEEQDSLNKLADFAQNKTLVVYSPNVLKTLKHFWGNRFVLEAQDLQEILKHQNSPFLGRKVEDIQKLSRKMIYKKNIEQEEEALLLFLSLFFSEILLSPYKEIFQPYEEILDLTAIGTLGDMMPLKNENRILIKQGLKQLSQTKNKGLQALISLKSLQGRRLKAYNVSWEITPTLNSAGRMGEANKSLELLLCEDLNESFIKAREIMSLNRKRKTLEKKIWDNYKEDIEQSFWDHNKKFAILFKQDIPKGLTGILASRIMKQLHVPTLVLSPQEDLIKGSLRAPEGFSAKDFIANMKDLLLEFGGHNSVAGFSLSQEKVNPFLERIKKFSLKEDQITLKRPPLKVDAFLPLQSFNPSLLEVVEKFEPFGKDYEDFIFEVHNVFLENFYFIGDAEKQHSVMLSVKGSTHRFQGIFWNGWPTLEKLNITPQTAVNLVFKFQDNFYKGQVSQRLSIIDCKLTGESKS